MNKGMLFYLVAKKPSGSSQRTTNFNVVDVSFGEQVIGSMEQDKFHWQCGGDKRRQGNDDDNDNDNKDDAEKDGRVLSFHDFKLYQLMLEKLFSNSSGDSFSNDNSNEQAELGLDLAHEAAERLKHAMCKNSIVLCC